jgi:HNH endonuclease
MTTELPKVPPPFLCIFCGADSKFTSEEHIVPQSLGNDLVVLAKGWVCDSCNTKFSAFESRVLFSSILGVERCRMGVITKRNRPARAKFHGVSWFSEPTLPTNMVTVEAVWDNVPHLINKNGTHGKLVFPLHDESNEDIGRLLLKIGIEILSPLLHSHKANSSYNLEEAKRYLVSGEGAPWPYFLLRDRRATQHLVSVFDSVPEEHEYIIQSGFDIFLHEIENQPIIFFGYSAFFAALCLTSREVEWRDVLVQWGASHVGCPKDFNHLSG